MKFWLYLRLVLCGMVVSRKVVMHKFIAPRNVFTSAAM